MLRRHALFFRLLVILSVLGSFAALTVPLTALAADSDVKVVAEGLDNPRGLAFGPHNALYVAEAGRGGGRCVRQTPKNRTLCYATAEREQ